MPEFVAPDIWIKGGLLDAKHVAKMGDALWLYLYIQARVRFKGDAAGSTPQDAPYKHADAAEHLGLGLRTVKRHLEHLVEHGYVEVAHRLPYGLVLAITKYEDVTERASRRRAEQPQRSAKSGTSGERSAIRGTSRSAKSGTEKCHSVSGEVPNLAPLYKGRTTETTEPTGEERARALTPLQLVVNAWMEANGRDPSKAKDYGRYVTVGCEMAERGDTPQDVRGCTRYLWSDPWRAEKGRRPSLEDVRDALPQWVEMGRPGDMKTMAARRERRQKTLRGGSGALSAAAAEAQSYGPGSFDATGDRPLLVAPDRRLPAGNGRRGLPHLDADLEGASAGADWHPDHPAA